MSKKSIEAPESFRKAWPRKKLRGWNAMNGRLSGALVLAWVYDSGKHEAVALDEGTDLHNLARKNIEAVRLVRVVWFRSLIWYKGGEGGSAGPVTRTRIQRHRLRPSP